MAKESATNRVDNAEKFTSSLVNLTRHEKAEIARLIINVRMRVEEREKAEEEKEESVTYENQGSRNMDEVDEVLIEALRILLKEDIEAFLRDGTLLQGDEAGKENNSEES